MKLTGNQIVGAFILTFIINSFTLKIETKDTVERIKYIAEQEMMCFLSALFSTLGLVVALYLYGRFFKKKNNER